MGDSADIFSVLFYPLGLFIHSSISLLPSLALSSFSILSTFLNPYLRLCPYFYLSGILPFYSMLLLNLSL